MDQTLLTSLPLGDLSDAVIAIVVAVVGWAIRTYLGERAGATAAEILNAAAPRAAKWARLQLKLADGDPIPPALYESAKQIGVDYLRDKNAGTVKRLRATPMQLADRVAVHLGLPGERERP